MAESKRITIVLGKVERRAAKALAARWGVTQSEAIRRALRQAESAEFHQANELRSRARLANLKGLFAAFSASEATVDEELRRISRERDEW